MKDPQAPNLTSSLTYHLSNPNLRWLAIQGSPRVRELAELALHLRQAYIHRTPVDRTRLTNTLKDLKATLAWEAVAALSASTPLNSGTSSEGVPSHPSAISAGVSGRGPRTNR